MPFLQNHPYIRGITLPPSGWVLAVLLAVYLFTGLIGHDPWKHDDAIAIGLAHDIIRHGHWLMPELGGQPYPDVPFYYWTAALSGWAFSWLLPFHDAARLSSAIYTLLALEFILLAARELHGREHAAAAPLMLAGSIGFLFHAHEAQPMLAALTMHTAAYWALALLPRRPQLATLVLGLSTGLGFLANGFLPVLTLIPLILATLWKSEQRRTHALRMVGALLLGLLIASSWLLPAWLTSTGDIDTLLRSETSALGNTSKPVVNLFRYLNLLLWYAWPALPLAAWALWSKRRFLRSRSLEIPLLSFFGALIFLGVLSEVRSATALLLLPPLVLFATPGVATLRRGAANAFDWFGMMTFTVFSVLVWIGWSAMVLGWPERLARNVVKLEPGFVGQFRLAAFLVALAAMLIWFWMISTSPRSPMRGIMHWMSGLTLFWILIAMLWMPWIDYGKSYRSFSAELARTLSGHNTGCVVNANLADSIRASLDYFEGLRTVHVKDEKAPACSLLLLQGTPRDPESLNKTGWKKIWEGGRPGDRRSSERIGLYQRISKSRSPAALPELSTEVPDGAPVETTEARS